MAVALAELSSASPLLREAETCKDVASKYGSNKLAKFHCGVESQSWGLAGHARSFAFFVVPCYRGKY